jgi:hypothetical protein
MTSTGLHDCQTYLDQHRMKSLDGETFAERDPETDLDTIATLYFPELRNEVLAFALKYREQILRGNELVGELLGAGQNQDARQNAYDKYMAQFNTSSKQVLVTAAVLRKATRGLLVSIMGVDEQQ